MPGSGLGLRQAPVSRQGSHLREPARVLLVLAADDIEESALQLLRDRSALSFADGPIVQFADRRDFGGGAGEERLVAGIDLVAGDALFYHRNAEVARERDDRVARDAVEARREVRRVQLAVVDQEEVF